MKTKRLKILESFLLVCSLCFSLISVFTIQTSKTQHVHAEEVTQVTCPQCNGVGTVHCQRHNCNDGEVMCSICVNGKFTTDDPCTVCSGTGKGKTFTICDICAEKCDNCNGSGKCPACGATGNCLECGGGGSKKCTNCDGEGCEECGDEGGFECDGDYCNAGECSECEGGKNCFDCEGRGYTIYEDECDTCNNVHVFYDPCTSCNGSKKNTITCTECGGDAFKDCPECGGDSIITCPTCLGNNKISYTETVTFKVACSKCDGNSESLCIYCHGCRDCVFCLDGKCGECGGEGCETCEETGGNCLHCEGSQICNSCNIYGHKFCGDCNGDGYVNKTFCAVSYDINGGTGTTPTITYYEQNKKATLVSGTGFSRTGYKFSGWSDNKNATTGSTTYNVGSTAKTLYGVWTEKTAISITEDAQSYNYNESSQPFQIKGTHKTLIYTLEYKVNNVWTSNAPKNSGSYDVKITRAEDDTYKAYTKEISNGLVINKAKIAVPTANNNLVYIDDEVAGVTLPSNAPYSLVDSYGYNVGNYTTTAILSDKTNFVWDLSTPTSDDQEIAWSISPAKIEVPTANSNLVYTGNEITGVTLPSGAKYTLSSNKETNAGTYYARASLEDTVNYVWDLSTPTNMFQDIQFIIAKAKVNVPTLAQSLFEYDGSDKEVVISGVETYMTKSNTSATKKVDVGTYTITYTLDNNHEWNSGNGILTWTITKAQSVINVDTTPIVITYGDTITLPAGTTNFGSVTVDKQVSDLTNVGEYIVTYTVADTNNYDGDTKQLSVKVNKATPSITLSSVEDVVVNEGENIVLPTATSDFGIVVCDKQLSDLVNPGTYTITYTVVGTDNYNTVTKTIQVTVNAVEKDDEGISAFGIILIILASLVFVYVALFAAWKIEYINSIKNNKNERKLEFLDVIFKFVNNLIFKNK